MLILKSLITIISRTIDMTEGSLPAGKYGGKDRRDAIIILFWVFCVVALVITLLRMYSRRMIRAVGADDWTMVFTTVNQECQLGWLTFANMLL